MLPLKVCLNFIPKILSASYSPETDSNRTVKITLRTIYSTLSRCTLSNYVCLGDLGIPLSTGKDGRVYGVGSLYDSDFIEEEILSNVFEQVLSHLSLIKHITQKGMYCQGEHHPFLKPDVIIKDMEDKFISIMA